MVQVNPSVLLISALHGGAHVLGCIGKQACSQGFAYTQQVIHSRNPLQTQAPVLTLGLLVRWLYTQCRIE